MKVDQMSGRERWISAISGKPVDRVPAYLLEGFKFDPNIDYTNDFTQSWRMDLKYRQMMADFSMTFDPLQRIGVYPFSRYLLIPYKFIEEKEIQKDINTKELNITIHTPYGDLNAILERKRGMNTIWVKKYPVQNMEDLQKLASVPFEIDNEAIIKCHLEYNKCNDELGPNGFIQVSQNSPIAKISHCMPFDLFLELSLIEKDYFFELLDMIVERYIKIFEAVFAKYNCEAVFLFSGNEQCTPPMMNPYCYDEYVLKYDKKIVDFLKSYGKLSWCHCHGNARHALGCMIKAGYQVTDPVEPPPQGDLTFDEAIDIVDNKITLVGNLEWEELEHKNYDYIVQRTLDILKHKDKRIILGSSAGIYSKLSDNCINNYYAVINTYRDFYGMKKLSSIRS